MKDYDENMPMPIKIKHMACDFAKAAASKALDLLIIAIVCIFVFFSLTGRKVLWIASESMVPTLKVYQFVLAEKAEASDLNIGDIATYKFPNKPYTITHRIVEDKGDCFVFKGDNNEKEDVPVPKEYVKYKIVAY